MILKAQNIMYNTDIKAMEFAITVPANGLITPGRCSAPRSFFVGREQ